MTLYLLQFLTVGAMFVTIIIFLDQVLEILLVEQANSQYLEDLYNNGIIQTVFFSLYVGMIFLTTFVSVALPIERAMGYLTLVSVILGVLMMSSIAGIAYFLAQRGFFPPVAICEPVPDEPDADCQF